MLVGRPFGALDGGGIVCSEYPIDMGGWVCDCGPHAHPPNWPFSGLSGLVGVPLAVSSMRRSACRTLALRSPLGPFFFGGCRYAHLIEAFPQGPQGSRPSHLTLRFRQQSQARRSAGLAVGGDVSSLV